jgi:hypothetical protein
MPIALVERGGPVNRRTLLATVVALLAMPGVAVAAVTVRVEGVHRSLLAPTVVHVQSGYVTRYGAPYGSCPARSAQGALNVATQHRWFGVWSTEFGPEYEITSILGEKHKFTSKYFWEIFIDNVSASSGACELKLHSGEQFLFAAVPQTGKAYPTAIKAPQHVTAGQSFSVEVVRYNALGKPKPLAGADVSGGGLSATTNSSGIATLTAPAAGTLVLHAHHAWSASTAYVRAAPVTVQVS